MKRDKIGRFFKENRDLWNGWTGIHTKSESYDVEGFKNGKSSLKPTELQELGDVSQKELLHLQCHFGLDTLSWARLGAHVTGVDFSRKAIEFALALRNEIGLKADFICSNVYDLEKVLHKKFDIVFTSYGVLCWLPDLEKWAQTIHKYLKDGGTFYIVELHPLLSMFDDDGSFKYPYFHNEQPMEFDCQGSYADPNAEFVHKSYEWSHSLGDIITYLITAGLTIEFLHEFPFTICGDHPFLVQDEDGLWRHKDKNVKIPMMFSIKAKRPLGSGLAL